MGGLLDMPRTAENLIGKKFGRLTVISRAATDKKEFGGIVNVNVEI